MERYYIDAEGSRQPDRRNEHELREIFGDVYEMLAPFMDPRNSWGGQSTSRLAYHAVRDRFPDLPAEAARILVEACLRRGHRRKNDVAVEKPQ
jgi:hypothetical protein